MCVGIENRFIPTKYTLFQILHQNVEKSQSNYIVTDIENICVSMIYLIVLRPVFNPTHKQNKEVKEYI